MPAVFLPFLTRFVGHSAPADLSLCGPTGHAERWVGGGSSDRRSSGGEEEAIQHGLHPSSVTDELSLLGGALSLSVLVHWPCLRVCVCVCVLAFQFCIAG